jgi:ribonuclease HI
MQRTKITEEGQPCRRCQTPVVRRTHGSTPPHPKAKGGGYWFEWWFYCPKCGALYMVEKAKRFFTELGLSSSQEKSPIP